MRRERRAQPDPLARHVEPHLVTTRTAPRHAYFLTRVIVSIVILLEQRQRLAQLRHESVDPTPARPRPRRVLPDAAQPTAVASVLSDVRAAAHHLDMSCDGRIEEVKPTIRSDAQTLAAR